MSSATTTTEPLHDTRNPAYVYEAPLRIWHWIHTFSFIVLAITGWLIANPLPSVGGEASDHFVMGNIRHIHFIAAYVFAIGFLIRVYWALVGNHYAREAFILPIWSWSWIKGVIYEIRFYLFLEKDMHKIAGHNPLAQTAMFLFNTLGTIFMIGTGFALYGEGLGAGSWADRMFGWIIPLIGDSEATHNWHATGMWVMIVFVIIHIYMAVRADIIGRESSVSTIIGGWRYWKDDKP
jgi:Ni/Fe-hydrogenase 1 B-type cytochrome subunit